MLDIRDLRRKCFDKKEDYADNKYMLRKINVFIIKSEHTSLHIYTCIYAHYHTYSLCLFNSHFILLIYKIGTHWNVCRMRATPAVVLILQTFQCVIILYINKS